MKAKVKDTGEIVDVMFIIHPDPVVKSYWCAFSGKGDVVDHYNESEIELIDTQETPIDWEQRRYEIAKEVLASSFSTPMEGTSILSYVRSCVQVADILIKELKGGEE